MKVAELMDPNVRAVSPEVDFETLLCELTCLPYRHFYVVGPDNKLLGVITSIDLLKVMVPKYLDAGLARALTDDSHMLNTMFKENQSKTARDLMFPKPIAVKPTDTVIEAEAVIQEHGFNAVPVVDEKGRLLGEVGRMETLKYITSLCCTCNCQETE